jgi:hypothetical protein
MDVTPLLAGTGVTSLLVYVLGQLFFDKRADKRTYDALLEKAQTVFDKELIDARAEIRALRLLVQEERQRADGERHARREAEDVSDRKIDDLYTQLRSMRDEIASLRQRVIP